MLVWINCSTIKSNVITKEKHPWKCCRWNEIILSFIKQVKCNTIKRQSRVFRSKTNLSFRLKRVVGNFHYPFQYLQKILFYISDSILCLGRPTWYSYIHKFFVSTRAGNWTFNWSVKIRYHSIYSLTTINTSKKYFKILTCHYAFYFGKKYRKIQSLIWISHVRSSLIAWSKIF